MCRILILLENKGKETHKKNKHEKMSVMCVRNAGRSVQNLFLSFTNHYVVDSIVVLTKKTSSSVSQFLPPPLFQICEKTHRKSSVLLWKIELSQLKSSKQQLPT